ncbi:hypothetical protein ABZV91_16485 [Nocardia sp. NPDC004568]|uniref:hypothetical protein n=1 Tax=Nocardia sp. NPDC004568 TaxID=3154551 RepID=UPI0033AEF437
MPKFLFIAAAAYLALIGLALLVVPAQFGVGAVPEDASPELIALLRLLSGPFLGVAVLNWISRKAEPGTARTAVLLADLVGFGVVAVNDIWGVISGDARDLARLFLIVHLAFAVAFAVAWWRSRRAPVPAP